MADNSDWEKLIKGRTKSEELFKKNGKGWPKKLFFIGVLLLLAAAIAYWWMYEHSWERNWKISRTEPLSATLPEGDLRLRTLLTPPGSQDGFTQFIAYSQTPGRLHVLTNATRPHWSQPYSAWFIEDPRIPDVVMLTEDFFCSRKTCFYIDINNAMTSNETAYHNVTLNMAEVPLPKHERLHLTEPCYSLNYRPCPIVVVYEYNDVASYGQIVMKTYNHPSIEVNQEGYGPAEGFKAFHATSEPKREAWMTRDGIDVFDIDRQINGTVIRRVNKEDTVQILTLSDELQIVVVMNEYGGKTRVRIFTLKPHSELVARDEIIINNKASAITALVHENTFEICHLSRTHVECYAKIVKE